MKSHSTQRIRHIVSGEVRETTQELLAEEPLSIRVQGNPYTVVMRTPGDEIAHVAGFCLGEGIVDAVADFGTLAFCDEDVNVVTVTLTPERSERVPEILDRRGFISQTSCGICGKELIDDLRQVTSTVDASPVAFEVVSNALDALGTHQPLREITRASHAAALAHGSGEILSVAEDAGRHNALDKAVGKLFLQDSLGEARFLVLSSRISYEMVQKAARAGIAIIAAVSRPTALAVELAEGLGITLCSLARGEGLFVYTHPHRIQTQSPE
ncbi:formate dehydrogenase accessory sulfurtransferase FdhD [Desulfoluna spongiiphila]|uniref:formate dehydrogenase accessory sulfurtransferase FdhD n=1 Tax=Desulfoluna spongiiphila TaxID=419481 RepID=UPI0012514E8F|nr:formate dehydrogenase accessory sulfurtransferase FdhD [Desulfoluna spongiiphila]VVS93158.1 sulfur carrier protein fdhd [Desulfoluna spongiiphila]